MNLEQYLSELISCPDKNLRQELGVYDNFPILLKANYDDFLGLLNSTG